MTARRQNRSIKLVRAVLNDKMGTHIREAANAARRGLCEGGTLPQTFCSSIKKHVCWSSVRTSTDCLLQSCGISMLRFLGPFRLHVHPGRSGRVDSAAACRDVQRRADRR